MNIKKLISNTYIYSLLRTRKNVAKYYKKIYNEQNNFKAILKSYKIKNYNELNNKNVCKMLNKAKITNNNDLFYYDIDVDSVFFDKKIIVGNITVDYNILLDNSLNDLMNIYNNDLINSLINYANRIDNKLVKEIVYKKCDSFVGALQRILFTNQLLWMTGHKLVGLGRLDKTLERFYLNDDSINKEKLKELLKEFLITLHKFYNVKSNMLLGDTGQIIILGGIDKDNNYLCNDITYAFLDALSEVKLPDPKILVRVSKNMPRKLIKKCVDCLKTGIGSPLFANDDVIIQSMINNGYEVADAYNYATSACWEPLIPGYSTDQNNIFIFNLPLVINNTVELICNKNSCSYDEFFKELSLNIENELERITTSWDVTFAEDPIESLFLHNTFENKTDLSSGDVKYNYFGILCPGFSNGINSLNNLKKIVFENKKISLKEFNDYRKNNFIDLNSIDLNEYCNYGLDDKEIIDLSNKIIHLIDKFCKTHKNKFGFNYKFGLSSPSYMDAGKKTEATFDGRKQGQPFGVHISSNKQIAYTELINFGSKLDYSGACVDGNVIDFMVTPTFIDNNYDKFCDFIYCSILSGFYEMQMNVVSYKTLIDAKKHPENYKDLIVRVWGFSAYFNDLPEEYKDYLIKRAEINEGISR